MSDTTTTQVDNTFTDFEGVETIPEITPASGAGAAAPENTETFDEDTYIKGLGFGSVEEVKAARAELEELRPLKEQSRTQSEIKFANEQSQRFFEYAKEGKEPELRQFLIRKEQLERMSAADVSKLEQAAEVIKLNMRLKNEDLTQDDVDFQFSEDFSLPEKPEQGEEEADDAFLKRENRWKADVERVEKRMAIAAKQAKPELAKYQSELVLPDIQRIDPKAQAAAQKELEDAEAEKKQYLTKLNGEFKNFSGFNATHKDKDVEYGVEYGITEEEKTVVKAQLESFATEGYSQYFGNRWFEKDGTPKIAQMMEDIYLLNNREKVFQKLVSESAAKRLDTFIKSKSNIQVDGKTPTGTFQPDDAAAKQEKELEFLMGA